MINKILRFFFSFLMFPYFCFLSLMEWASIFFGLKLWVLSTFRAYLCSAWITCSARNLFPCRCRKAVLTPKPCSLGNNFFVESRKISSNCSCFRVEKCLTNLLKFWAYRTSAFSVASLNAHCYTYMLLLSTTRNASSLDNWNYGITMTLQKRNHSSKSTRK